MRDARRMAVASIPDNTIDSTCECVPNSNSSCASFYGSVGVCAATNLTCTASGKWPNIGVCQAAASAEVCDDFIDNDCDGMIDEATECPCSAAPCDNGGVCTGTGGSGYSCDCSGTGFVGATCSEPVSRILPTNGAGQGCEAVAISNNGDVLANGDWPAARQD